MKFFKYLPFALAIAAMVGCSDDNFVEDTTNDLGDGGYVNVKINLPSMSGSRASSLEDGTPSEYYVDNATILLFDGSTDPKVLVNETYTGAELGFAMNGNTNITSTSTKVMIPAGVTPEYILVLLNRPSSHTSVITGINPNTVYSDIIKKYQGAAATDELSAVTGTYHFMSNSTFDNVGSGVFGAANSGSTLQSLQKIDPNSIAYDKITTTTTSTNVYVERASVKVDLSFGLTGQDASDTKSGTPGYPTITFGSTDDQLVINGWRLTVRNNNYYPVKQIDQTKWNEWTATPNSNGYHMYNDVNGNTNFRSYWAMDPTYDATLTSSTYPGQYDEFTYASYNDASAVTSYSDPQYCLENTFTAVNQVQNQTTSVLISGIYSLNGTTPGSDVYMMNNVLYKPDDFRAALAAKMHVLGYKNGTTDLSANDFTLVTNDKYIYKNLVTYSGSNDLTLGGSTELATAATSADNITKMNTILNSFGSQSVVYYKGGKCYYTVRIRHFDDSEVPLYDANSTTGYDETCGTGGVNKPHQEGRYGVVRNHWYSININSIKQIGRPVPTDPSTPINPDPGYPDPNDPTITPPTPTPDDVEEKYIDAKINILPWARRNQSADI